MERDSRYGMPGTLILRWEISISIFPMFFTSFLRIIRTYFHLHFIHYDLKFLSQ